LHLNCVSCGRDVPGAVKIYRRDTCPYCHSDLHSCINCEFYDVKGYHQCRESSAEYIQEKEKANVCDYFRPLREKKSFIKKSEMARQKLEELFKKP